MRNNTTNEIKIAIFVLSGLFLLIFGWAFLREITIEKQVQFKVIYSDVAGLSRGSFIHINGLRVGRVDKLTLDAKKRIVVVDARVQIPDIQIPKDSLFIIRTSGYVGDKFLDIVLGNSTEYIKNGDVLRGQDVFDSFKSLDKFSKIIDQIDAVELGMNIQDFSGEAVTLVRKASNVADNTNNVVKSLPKGDELTSLVNNAKITVEKLDDSISQAESLINSTIKDEQAIANINNILSQAKTVSDDVSLSIQNANTLVNNKEAFDRMNVTLDKANKLTTQLNEIKNDPLIQNDLKETLENTNEAAQNVSDALHQRFIFPKMLFGTLLPKKK